MPEAPVQQKILIDDIRDDMVILKDGGLRAILMTSSTNFALKSEDEQDALIMGYQQFLNSLDFPIEILTLTRRLDISNYLTLLEEQKKEQTNELLKIQIAEYIDFVKSLVQAVNIMSQSFLVVVPLSPMEKKEGGFIEKLGLFKNPNQATEQKSLEELKSQLWQRVDYVRSGLSGLGLRAATLATHELMDLFYHAYNMGLREKPTFNLGGRG